MKNKLIIKNIIYQFKSIYTFNSTDAIIFISTEVLRNTPIGIDARHKGIYVDHIDNTYDIYILAFYEASLNAGNYKDNHYRTADEKFFHIYSGKVAELNNLWDCTTNFGDIAIRGVQLFGKADDGVDSIFQKIDKVQVKYFHWTDSHPYVNISLSNYEKYKNCKLFVTRCQLFDKHYRPPKTGVYKTRPMSVPLGKYEGWTMFDVDLKKMIKDNVSKICFESKSISSHQNPYVDYVQRKYYM